MKNKKLLILSFFMMLILPLNVRALELTSLDIKCPKSVVKEKEFTCVISGSLDEAGEVSGTINYDNDKFSMETNTFTATGSEKDGSYVFSTNVALNSKSLSGNGNVEVREISLSGTDVSNTKATEVLVLDDNSSLKAIKIDGSTIEGFSSSNKTYSLNSSNASLTITADAEAATTKIEGVGSKSISCGTNNFTVTGIAEDESKTSYSITINRKCSRDTYLKNIAISKGTLSPAFQKDTKNYTVEVPSDVEVIDIVATKNNDKQTTSGDAKNIKLAYGENKITITVTSEAGDKGYYNIKINRKDDRSNDTILKSITLSAGKLKFEKNKTLYKTKVLYEVESIKAEAIANSEKAKVEIIGGDKLVVGENTITIKVTAEDEKTTTEYKIIVNRLKEGETLGDNAYIGSLKIKGYDIDFKKDKFSYTLKIDNEKSLDIDIVMEDENAKAARIIGNEKLKNGSVIKIITTSADGEVQETYEIKIEKSNMIFILLISIVSIALASLILFIFISKNKKKKDKVVDKEIRGKDLVNKVNDQLDNTLEKTIEYKNEEDVQRQMVDPIDSYLKNGTPANEDIILKINKMNENRNLSAREELRREQLEDAYSNILSDENKITYKTCSICGHKVIESAKTCPYCRREF